METIKRRSILQFALLNIITFGIYGIVAGNGIGRDIDTLCSGDGENEVSYVKAWLLGIITGGIYLEYWWYKQANRLKYNAGRYNLVVRESGLSLLAFRSYSSLLKTVVTFYFTTIIIGKILSSFVMSSLGALSYMYGGYGGYGMGSGMPSISGFWLVFILITCITPSWSIFGYIGLSFLIKNLNRYAEVSETYEPRAFHPLGYEYYKAECNYPAVGLEYDDNSVVNSFEDVADIEAPADEVKNNEEGMTELFMGCIIGVSGSNAGYRFELKDGEEIIIGKDPSSSSIIIDSKYRDVSRKHCGIIYQALKNEYQIIDYSANGTYVNGRRLPVHVKTRASAGTELVLGDSDNKFRLG